MSEPTAGTVERWAWEYILTTSLDAKLAPPPVPERWDDAPLATRPTPPRAPGRPPELRVVKKAPKVRGLNAASGRARALHTFFHHELQAAELMAWAVLAYPDTPLEFRAGLVRIATDEIRHMRMYTEAMKKLGYELGAFEVRDWFWERIPSAKNPAEFVAAVGLGIESANLEHANTFAEKFRAAGDEESARVQELVGLEEIAHVRFGVRWFEHFRGPLAFREWESALPAPLSPLLMRGNPMNREARRRAGQPQLFIDELDAWMPPSPGS